MSIELRIFHDRDGHGVRSYVRAAHGYIDVKEAIYFLTTHLSPVRLANGVSASVLTVDRDQLVVAHGSDHRDQFSNLEEIRPNDGNFDRCRYVFIQSGVVADYDFAQLRQVLWTYAKAWGQEYPGDLGTVIDQLKVLEAQSV